MTIRSFELLQPRSVEEAIELLAKHGDEANASVEESVKTRVHELTRRFPIY